VCDESIFSSFHVLKNHISISRSICPYSFSLQVSAWNSIMKYPVKNQFQRETVFLKF
jgi:hypothetical protein